MVAPGLHGKSLPSKGIGHSGMLKNEWLNSLLSNWQLKPSTNFVFRVPQYSCNVTLFTGDFAWSGIQNRVLAPTANKKLTALPSMSNITHGSTGVIWIFWEANERLCQSVYMGHQQLFIWRSPWDQNVPPPSGAEGTFPLLMTFFLHMAHWFGPNFLGQVVPYWGLGHSTGGIYLRVSPSRCPRLTLEGNCQ